MQEQIFRGGTKAPQKQSEDRQKHASLPQAAVTQTKLGQILRTSQQSSILHSSTQQQRQQQQQSKIVTPTKSTQYELLAGMYCTYYCGLSQMNNAEKNLNGMNYHRTLSKGGFLPGRGGIQSQVCNSL